MTIDVEGSVVYHFFQSLHAFKINFEPFVDMRQVSLDPCMSIDDTQGALGALCFKWSDDD